MQLTADLTGLTPAVRQQLIKKLAHEDKARHDLGVIEQRRMAQRYQNLPIGSFKAELGPAQMILSQDQWQRAMQKYGETCWQDPDFTPWLLKRNEDMRVRQTGTKIQVGWTPGQAPTPRRPQPIITP